MRKILKYNITENEHSSSEYTVPTRNSVPITMNITLKNNCYTNFVEKNLFIWNRLAKERQKKFVVALFWGIALLSISLLLLHRATSPYAGFTFGIAFTWLIFTIGYKSSTNSQKEKLIKRSKKYSEHMCSYGIETETRISNEKISFRDAESYSEFSWKRFAFFEFTSEFLVLTSAAGMHGSFFIDTDKMLPEELSTLKNFAEKNLRPYKN